MQMQPAWMIQDPYPKETFPFQPKLVNISYSLATGYSTLQGLFLM